MNEGSFAGCALLVGTIVLSIISGILAWNWIEPESFVEAIAFIIAWGLFSYVSHIVIGGIIMIISEK